MIDFRVYVAAALVVSICLWQDATPNVTFPDALELVKIELGRVLTTKHAWAKCHATISPAVTYLSMLPPWDVDVDAFLRLVESDIAQHRINADVLGKEILDRGHEDKLMLPRKAKTIDDAHIRQLSFSVGCAVGLPNTMSQKVFTLASTKYNDVHKAIRMHAST